MVIHLVQIEFFFFFYIIKILTAQEGNMRNCFFEKNNVDRGESEVDIDFRGVTISHVTLSCSQYLLYCTVVWFQNPGQVNI